jgi:L-seryl-tRNA(Ser) seleniumtransferase
MNETSSNESSFVGRLLPSVDTLVNRSALVAAGLAHGRSSLLAAVRASLAEVRALMAARRAPLLEDRDAVAQYIERQALAWLEERAAATLRPVFNLTGTVLHTNLGRAPLARAAIDAMCDVAGGCNVEYDLEHGSRGERDGHIAALLRRITGAEDALAVNNNAAAVLLALSSLASRREVLVSRGELIEIGGAFRMPDVMALARCKLVEVGTTNRTHLADYANTIGPRTAALMKVHPSNYAITGFTATVPDAELAALAQRHGLPYIVDLGSGTLTDLKQFGLPPEPTPQQVLAHGADVVTFSGDKLLGGPQAGLVVGRKELIARMQRNPLKRALRLDKVILAALAATLRLYDDPDGLVAKLPTLRLLARPEHEIRELAERIRQPLGAVLSDTVDVLSEPCLSQIGSGSLPVDRLRSWCLRLRPRGPKRGTEARLNALVRAFRALPVPVIGRVQEGALVLDLRCLEDEEGFLSQLERLTGARPR